MACNGSDGAYCTPSHPILPGAARLTYAERRLTGHHSPPSTALAMPGDCGPPVDAQMLCRLAALLAARQLRCPVETILSDAGREAPVAAARQLAMYLAHVGLGLSQHQVAVGFARDRRTVSHACHRVEDRRDDAAFDAQVTDIESQIRWAAGR